MRAASVVVAAGTMLFVACGSTSLRCVCSLELRLNVCLVDCEATPPFYLPELWQSHAVSQLFISRGNIVYVRKALLQRWSQDAYKLGGPDCNGFLLDLC